MTFSCKPLNTVTSKQLFTLLRAALWHETPSDDFIHDLSADSWQKIYKVATSQGVLAIAWDGLEQLIAEGLIPQERQPPLQLKIQWAYNVEQIEKRSAEQVRVLSELTAFYHKHGIPTMLLKGYGVSLDYPIPAHRPCGDIDIWLFGQQEHADALLHREKGTAINLEKHHHTVFSLDGITVENHYDFLNVHAHASNREIEKKLQELAAEPEKKVLLGEAPLYLPSVDFNALFLLRHTAGHFAAEKIGLRHLIDWTMFIDRHSEEIDWTALKLIVYKMNMHRFFRTLCALSIDYLGLDESKIPPFERDAQLEERVMNELLHPEFSEKVPKGNIFTIVRFKFCRWWANRWKHRIVYRENLLSSFFRSSWSHLLKPKSIK